jgi:hypothetical protein
LPKETTYAAVENGQVFEVSRTDIQYARQADGTLKAESYSEEYKNTAGAVVKSVDKVGIKYKDGKENSFQEITSVKKGDEGNIERTLRVVKNGKEESRASTTLDRDGNQVGKVSAGPRDQKDAATMQALQGINEASKGEGLKSASPGSMKKIAMKKFKEGMGKLEQQLTQIAASARESAAKIDKVIEQGQRISALKKAGEMENRSREGPQREAEAAGPNQEL